ncbi:BZIP transcription factor 11 [Arabidopsis thaliana]|uniref:bZIP transcription factor 11 n=4 Tax=Arabidopsis TaxID=3701 RepID=BZP11_ARATH|nr:G-box binding factor 6 [Arabidopsis thaliana]O65683.1 RecName: Full=bZIP transcription factor 11; Short=AtbZIP11; AltName: Full=G-box-binding factor 6; AltName: Full=bZIP transcription factor ATB2 [Arabidopsis thaliana]KAG7618422.1 Basic-leucine zipper domain [Arabidopsis thaliana x Arabidopsis arenosa]KAG7622878.1 Basic-leucine zipper domain [Arabidopsis suecica]AAL36335.1 putative bZIP transcription factor ATB2 [Arabidopsis thaliana]AAM20036.1 putative bZIP transcription factor ATB2 [Arab|eukprot:NP_195185.1 G-box binding factor 6 [Arabidopsis thaliana]
MESSSSGTTSSTIQTSSGSEESLMEQRKRKRMLSNRESARRSRMKKQKLLDDLTAQVNHLKKENTEIVTSVSITTQHYLTVEAENSVLRAQLDELNHRLQSLNDIIEFLDSSNNNNNNNMGMCSNPLVGLECDDFFVNQMNMSYIMNQPLMASSDALMY